MRITRFTTMASTGRRMKMSVKDFMRGCLGRDGALRRPRRVQRRNKSRVIVAEKLFRPFYGRGHRSSMSLPKCKIASLGSLEIFPQKLAIRRVWLLIARRRDLVVHDHAL